MHKYFGAWANNKYSPYMIVGLNPTFMNEDKNEEGFKKFYFQDSNNLKVIKEFFGDLLDVEDCHISNLCKCATTENNNALLTPSMAKGCFEKYLFNEIELIKPKIIFLLGNQAFEQFEYIVEGDEGFALINKFDFDSEVIYYMHLPHPAARNKTAAMTMAKEALEQYKHVFKIVDRDRAFNQLHFHNHFSVHDSIIRLDEHVEFMQKHHKKQIISTNHGTLCDTYQIFSRAKDAKLKPIAGCELYCLEDFDVFKKTEEPAAKKEIYKNRNHLVLIAKDEIGLKNLIKIHNFGWTQGFYWKPLVSLDYIREHTEGLIALSACTSGFISSKLLKGQKQEALMVATKLKEMFKDDFYVEIPLIHFKDQIIISDDLIKIANQIGSKIVVTNDIHYLEAEDRKYRDFAYKIFLDKDIASEDSCDDLYFKSYSQMKSCWKNMYKTDVFTEGVFEQAIDNVISILDSIKKFDIEKKSPKSAEENEQKLEALVKEEFFKRFDVFEAKKKNLYWNRLKLELQVIKNKKLAEYFLIIWDIVKYVKDKYGPHAVGAGRGSAAGSLVNYLLNITTVDPIEFDLLFERFLSDARDDLADIDVDFIPSSREDIFQYVKAKYGEDKCLNIGTHAYIKTRNAIQDVGRDFKIPSKEIYDLTTELDDLDESKSLEELRTEYKILDEFFVKCPQIVEYVSHMRGIIRQYSSHAAGLIISAENLIENIPVMRTSSQIVTAWQEGSDFRELTNLGYYKYDILGLNNLEIEVDTLKLLSQIGYGDVLKAMKLDDPKVYEYMKTDDYMGIFQFESSLARGALEKIKPDRFDDYVAVNALLRPGPLKAGMIDVYARRKHGTEQYTVPPQLQHVIGETYGVIVYQEQIMKICHELAGFSLNEANMFRKALVKYSRSLENEIKRIQQVMDYKNKFVDGATKTLGKEKADEIFELILSFVAYGFNLSHALTYAYISYEEMYLKTYFPLRFYTALINNTEMSVKDDMFEFKMLKYLVSAANHGIEILPPDINKSKTRCVIEKRAIRYGLSFIKNISTDDCTIIESLQPFTSFEDFTSRVPKKQLNKRKVEALIFTGCLSEFGKKDELLDKFYKGRKEKVDVSAININEQYLDFMYFDLIGMMDFFRDSVTNETNNPSDQMEVWKPVEMKRKIRDDKQPEEKQKALEEIEKGTKQYYRSKTGLIYKMVQGYETKIYAKVGSISTRPKYSILCLYTRRQFFDRICLFESLYHNRKPPKDGDVVFATIQKDDLGGIKILEW